MARDWINRVNTEHAQQAADAEQARQDADAARGIWLAQADRFWRTFATECRNVIAELNEGDEAHWKARYNETPTGMVVLEVNNATLEITFDKATKRIRVRRSGSTRPQEVTVRVSGDAVIADGPDHGELTASQLADELLERFTRSSLGLTES